jgi:hypothetical protein
MAGGVLWTRDLVDTLFDGYKAIKEDDVATAVRKFAKVAISAHIGADLLPDAVHDYLLKANHSEERARRAANTIKALESPIANEIEKQKSK